MFTLKPFSSVRTAVILSGCEPLKELVEVIDHGVDRNVTAGFAFASARRRSRDRAERRASRRRYFGREGRLHRQVAYHRDFAGCERDGAGGRRSHFSGSAEDQFFDGRCGRPGAEREDEGAGAQRQPGLPGYGMLQPPPPRGVRCTARAVHAPPNSELTDRSLWRQQPDSRLGVRRPSASCSEHLDRAGRSCRGCPPGRVPVSVTGMRRAAGTLHPYACAPRETLALVPRTTLPSCSRRIVMPTRETFDSSKRTSALSAGAQPSRQQLQRRRLLQVARVGASPSCSRRGPRAVAQAGRKPRQQLVVGEVRLGGRAELVQRPGAGVAGGTSSRAWRSPARNSRSLRRRA